MIVCPSCNRHHRTDETACPFCERSAASIGDRPFGGMGKTIGAALTTFVLAACYGTGVTDKDTTHSGDTHSGPTTEESTDN